MGNTVGTAHQVKSTTLRRKANSISSHGIIKIKPGIWKTLFKRNLVKTIRIVCSIKDLGRDALDDKWAFYIQIYTLRLSFMWSLIKIHRTVKEEMRLQGIWTDWHTDRAINKYF